MIWIVIEIILSTVLICGLWHYAYTEYKEREWRRNNPDEHAQFERNTVSKHTKE